MKFFIGIGQRPKIRLLFLPISLDLRCFARFSEESEESFALLAILSITKWTKSIFLSSIHGWTVRRQSNLRVTTPIKQQDKSKIPTFHHHHRRNEQQRQSTHRRRRRHRCRRRILRFMIQQIDQPKKEKGQMSNVRSSWVAFGLLLLQQDWRRRRWRRWDPSTTFWEVFFHTHTQLLRHKHQFISRER